MKKVKGWEILTIGCLTRNKYWGEQQFRAQRECLATSALVRTKEGNIVIDPSMEPELFERVLFDRSGLRPGDIDLVCCTHLHGDHFAGIELFGHAQWYMSREDLSEFTGNDQVKQGIRRKMKPAPEFPVPDCVQSVSLPGHTAGLCGFLFEAPEGRVLVSGDCVMTKDFFRNGEGYFFDADGEQNRKSMERAASLSDIIIPGHGNYFLTKAYEKGKGGYREK